MKEQWSPDGSVVKIFGDYSPHTVIVQKEVVDHFGSTEETFHAIHRLRKANCLSRPDAGKCFPFSMRDIEFAEENMTRGECYWRYGTLYPSIHEYVCGYYRLEGSTAVFSGGTRVNIQQYLKADGSYDTVQDIVADLRSREPQED